MFLTCKMYGNQFHSGVGVQLRTLYHCSAHAVRTDRRKCVRSCVTRRRRGEERCGWPPPPPPRSRSHRSSRSSSNNEAHDTTPTDTLLVLVGHLRSCLPLHTSTHSNILNDNERRTVAYAGGTSSLLDWGCNGVCFACWYGASDLIGIHTTTDTSMQHRGQRWWRTPAGPSWSTSTDCHRVQVLSPARIRARTASQRRNLP